MIIPGILKKTDLRPNFNFSWIVIYINIAVFFGVHMLFQSWPQKNNDQDFLSKNFNASLSQMYLQTLDETEKKQYLDLPLEKVALVAIRDQRFWSRAAHFPFKGDVIQIEANKKVLLKLQHDYQDSVQYQLGLGAEQTSPWVWITYQFTHYSFLHLISNLVFLFFGILYLEKQVTAGWIGSVYILGGISGGISFLLCNQSGNLSVIGASGSVCALLSFLMVIKKNELMPWTYFLAPIPKGYGEIYLPAFLIFPVYLLADFTSMLWNPSGISASVAHSAHVGGTIMGFILGLSYLLLNFFRSKSAAHGIFSDHDGLDKLF